MYFENKCILCGQCVENCPHNAISIETEEFHINRDLCNNCNDPSCFKECFTEALRICGYDITVSKLFDIILRDRQFWGSKGGITLTGGEPLLQFDFVKEILSRCYDSYIHTAIETCGFVPVQNLIEILPFCDWIFFDLKHMNPIEHLNGTLADNQLILVNAKRLSREFKGRLIFRLPVIKKYNDSEQNINEIIEYIKETGRHELNILPLHHLGREKYRLINKTYKADKDSVPDRKDMESIKELCIQKGIDCYIGDDTPF